MALMPRKGALAVALVIEIAVYSKSHPLTGKILSARYGFSPRHFETMLQGLVRTGILKSTRGPRGGYKLARKPARIKLNEILLAAGAADVSDARVRSTLRRKAGIMGALGKTQRALSAALACISVEDLTRSLRIQR
jgi:Rrf2 family transcriptional regulator, iron-sulfur cluster assembly transcription factor